MTSKISQLSENQASRLMKISNYGASLSHVNSNGTGGASSPQILADVMIPSDFEIAIMTAQECVGSSCGYVRPGAVAYRESPNCKGSNWPLLTRI